MSEEARPGMRTRHKDGLDRPLPARFYREVTIATIPSPLVGEGQGGGDRRTSAVGAPPTPNPSPQGGGEYRVLLDGKPVRTPRRAPLQAPTQALAEAIADEWRAQSERIDPSTMPLTTLANTVIDGIAGREALIAADIVKYAGSDLLCYRAEEPAELVRRQAEAWDPMLAWAAETLGAEFTTVSSIMPVRQPQPALERIGDRLKDLDAFRLGALHVMTTLTGSAVLALAHAHGAITAERAWTLAHLDEDFQISKWGEDAEASAYRSRRRAEMQAASRLMELLGAP